MTNIQKDNKKEIYSFIILFSIIPILLIPGLSQLIKNETFVKTWDLLFTILVSFLFLYVIREITLFIFNKNLIYSNDEDDFQKLKSNSFNLVFIFTSFIYITLFYYFGINSSLKYSETMNLQLLLEVVVILLILLNLFFLFLKDVTLIDQLVLSFVLSLLFIFFVGLIFITIYFSFAMIFFLVLMTSVNDMSAYFFGKQIGRNHIVSHISPNKTLEGFLSGAIVSFFFGIIWFFIFIFPNYSSAYMPFQDSWRIILLLFTTIIIAPLGDLFFSKIKREYNVKDFGTIIPGHGGILDRIDSHIFVISFSLIILLV